LIQKDMKRLLSFHAISQVGYMTLGIGTALPVGIIGGLFHMINHVIYKCCLFLTAGSVEKQVGTTNLGQFGGLGRFMPITAICFIVAALSISGVPPFNGFFSKELVFDAALESGMIFYIAALVGAFLTAASFLKLGHSAFFGKAKMPEGINEKNVVEAPGAMLLPMILLAALCVFFGLGNAVPLSFIQPLLGDSLAGADFSGWPHSMTLVLISVAVLLLAALNHYIGVRSTGSALKAVDHIHHMPVLRQIYNGAEKHYFDPYSILMLLVKFVAYICFSIDRSINWIYDVFFVKIITGTSAAMKNFSNGSISRYISWMFAGIAFLLLLFIVLV
jgi:NADH:ubiquinone oxidoreductase subunit 5 (subunit L)/multisubunit Na+/H+ antiporter MnhA subunit